MNRFNLRRILLGLALAAGCMLVGAAIPTTNQALGEVRGTVEQPQFQSASVPLLREIAGTLRQIDARLARLETTVQKLQSTAAKTARSSSN
jgi:hypothetical protein